MENTATTHRHVFETSGKHGKAPYKVVGYDYAVGPVRFIDKQTGIEMTCGSPGQPMGCCDHCGTGIAHIFIIESSDGVRFKVGSDCVLKTGDEAMKKVVDARLKPVRSQMAAKQANADREYVLNCIGDKQIAEILTTRYIHPFIKAKSYFDYAEWMLQFGGKSGVSRVAKRIRSIMKREGK